MTPANRDQHTIRIAKILSANDTGDTGGHQAGVLVPKEKEILDFFPSLDAGTLNPRVHLVFRDDVGERWEFAFIYYNNRLFGGTRNEYRLTRMTNYIRTHRLRPGDRVMLERDPEHRYFISYERQTPSTKRMDGVLRLGANWIVIPTGDRA
jgi:hypothetical protein